MFDKFAAITVGALASIGALAFTVSAIIAPVWWGVAGVLLSLVFSTVALLVSVRADTNSKTALGLQQHAKAQISSQAEEVEQTLKHGT